MINNKKTIGLCITKFHDRTRSEFIDFLFGAARKMGYGLVVYNSFSDFFKKSEYLMGSKYVYDNIDYSILDAMIVMNETIFDKDIVDRVISRSKANNVPVIIIKGEAEGCISITDDYCDAYKQLIRHVIRDHGVRDTFFIAGNKENDLNTEKRLGCYKDVLEEEGLEFSENNVDYGQYWDGPVIKIIDRLAAENRIPRAIICANDVMAMTACIRLKKYGKTVPDDVIVTGFDGTVQADMFSPVITTCCEDVKSLAERTVNVITDIFEGRKTEEKYVNSYLSKFTESCGCPADTQITNRQAVWDIYNVMTEMNSHEDYIYSKLDRILNKPSLSEALKIISYVILGGSYLIIDNKFLAQLADLSEEGRTYTGDYTIVTHSDSWDTESDPCTSFNADGTSLPGHDPKNSGMIVLNPIFVGKVVCGYHTAVIDNACLSAHKVKRITKSINISFNEMYNRQKQKTMKHIAEEAAYTNPISGLANLRGACKWFTEFSADEKNRNRPMSVSIYAIAKYKYIYENYGISEVENAVKTVADGLRSANPDNCFVGQVSENEFIVINYYSSSEQISKTIDSATSNFFSLMSSFNSINGKDYYIEVNCGCTVVDPGWNGTLSSYIKSASGDMYMNKLNVSTERKKKAENTQEYDEEVFTLLIEQNLFRYCFQPIVDAKTGDIYAYEALMRTDDSIHMSPLEILNAASQCGRLYDIERATLYNVMEHYVHTPEVFGRKKVFINLIPGYFLNEADYAMIGTKYGEYMDNFVFEITEQNTLSDDELDRIKKLGGDYRSNQVAVDDFGTGHSNIVNLLRYSPQIIKIDRFLITDIDKDVNKQMFIKSTIEFARLNSIKVLAEGVETSEEMKTVISFGVDYIQGYYTGRPVFDPISEIDESIREEIINSNNEQKY
ncbi:MAG: EAL domain-containing protein [Oscillospiraceae bacterium]